jgi:Fe2+ transport system protein B
LGVPAVVALTMMDIAEREGTVIDVAAIAGQLGSR